MLFGLFLLLFLFCPGVASFTTAGVRLVAGYFTFLCCITALLSTFSIDEYFVVVISRVCVVSYVVIFFILCGLILSRSRAFLCGGCRWRVGVGAVFIFIFAVEGLVLLLRGFYLLKMKNNDWNRTLIRS